MLSTHLIYFGFWAAYYALHSFLAMDKVKARVPIKPQLYRFLYSLLSVVLLLYVLLVGAMQRTFYLLTPNENTKALAAAFSIVGIFVIKRAFRNYSLRAFLGFKKEDSTDLKTDGIQSRIRHPLYAGTVLVVLGFFFFSPNMINMTTFLSLLVYLPFGIILEERKLIKRYGKAYLDYREKLPALVPNPSRTSK